jgi:hypothetical protein
MGKTHKHLPGAISKQTFNEYRKIIKDNSK